MPYTLKKDKFKYKNPQTGNYEGIDVVAERDFADYRNELETVGNAQETRVTNAGTTQVNAVNAAGTAAVANFPATADATDTLAADFAATYVPNQAYNVGDFCTYQYKLYTCKTAIAENADSTFVTAHWTQVNISDSLTNQVGDLKNAISNELRGTGGVDTYFEQRAYYIGGSGKWIESNGRHIAIPVTPDDTVALKANGDRATQYAMLKSDNAAYNTAADFCADTYSETWAEVKSIAKNTIATITVPSDATILYLLVHAGTAENIATPVSVKINNVEYNYCIREKIDALTSGLETVSADLASNVDMLDERIDVTDETLSSVSEHTVNLWEGDASLSFITKQIISLTKNIPAGTYTFSAQVTSTDIDNTVSRAVFQTTESENIICDLSRGMRSSATFTASDPIKKVTFYASVGVSSSEGDEATFANIQIEAGSTATDYVVSAMTAVDLLARTTASPIAKMETTHIVDLSKARIVYGVISSGVWDKTVNAKNQSVLIDAKDYQSVTITSAADKGTKLTFLVSDRYPYNDGDNCYPADIVDGTSSIVVPSDTTRTYPIPTEAKLICITIRSADSDCTPTSVSLYKKSTPISDLTYYSGAIAEEIIAVRKMYLDSIQRLDKSFNYIAYSGLNNSGHSMNTKEHYLYAAQQSVFTCIKGDMRPTKDNKIIMCHDDGFTLQNGDIVSYDASSENTVVIKDTNYSILMGLKHASTQEYVTDFETFIKVCKKYGKVAFITIRDEKITDILDYMFGIINKHNMIDYVMFNSFTSGTLQAIRGYNHDVALELVISSSRTGDPDPDNPGSNYPNGTLKKDDVDLARSLGKCVIATVDYNSSIPEQNVSREPSANIEYARQNNVRLYSGVLYHSSQIDQLIDYGYSGAQILIVPVLT